MRKGLEELLQLLGGNADPCVAHSKAKPVSVVRHRERNHPVAGEFRGVAEEVEQRLAQLGDVRLPRTQLVGDLHDEPVAVLRNQRRYRRHDAFDHGRHGEILDMRVHLSGFDLGKIEHVVNELQQVFSRRAYLLEIGDLLFPTRILGVFRKYFAIADDGVERGSQLMRDVGEKRALGLVRQGGDVASFGQLLCQLAKALVDSIKLAALVF